MGRGGDSDEKKLRDSFIWSDKPEPHAERKTKILKAHPEIKELMGPCPWTKYQVFFVVVLQIAMCIYSTTLSWSLLVPLAYIFGGAANCNLQLAMHEISHNLAFKGTSTIGMFSNRVLSLIANLPLAIPAAISFRKYHLEHHRYQGHEVVDADLPTHWEGWFFTSPMRKIAWCMLQPAFYALRPLFTSPKPLIAWELVNIIVQLSFDYMIYTQFGMKALAYLLLGTLLGMGIHPTAYHFISEHCVFVEGYETYSYYGYLNYIMYNVGYHNEHHDFPNIPGSRLYLVKQYAPEFYDDLPQHNSWFKVYYDYITRPDVNPFNRIKRVPITEVAKTEADAQLKKKS